MFLNIIVYVAVSQMLSLFFFFLIFLFIYLEGKVTEEEGKAGIFSPPTPQIIALAWAGPG